MGDVVGVDALEQLREQLRSRTPPETLTLVGQRISVEVVEESKYLGDSKMGQFRSGEQRILIRASVAEDQRRDTLLHEVLHALGTIVGLGDEDVSEERYVATLTPLLLDALRRNPQLAAYLVAQ